MTPEGRNTAYLKRRVKDLGGTCRKCVWAGIAGAPDWLILFPYPSRHAWIELKAPGKSSRPIQLHEQQIMRQAGCMVFQCDSPAEIDQALDDILQCDSPAEIDQAEIDRADQALDDILHL